MAQSIPSFLSLWQEKAESERICHRLWKHFFLQRPWDSPDAGNSEFLFVLLFWTKFSSESSVWLCTLFELDFQFGWQFLANITCRLHFFPPTRNRRNRHVPELNPFLTSSSAGKRQTMEVGEKKNRGPKKKKRMEEVFVWGGGQRKGAFGRFEFFFSVIKPENHSLRQNLSGESLEAYQRKLAWSTVVKHVVIRSKEIQAMSVSDIILKFLLVGFCPEILDKWKGVGEEMCCPLPEEGEENSIAFGETVQGSSGSRKTNRKGTDCKHEEGQGWAFRRLCPAEWKFCEKGKERGVTLSRKKPWKSFEYLK